MCVMQPKFAADLRDLLNFDQLDGERSTVIILYDYLVIMYQQPRVSM